MLAREGVGRGSSVVFHITGLSGELESAANPGFGRSGGVARMRTSGGRGKQWALERPELRVGCGQGFATRSREEIIEQFKPKSRRWQSQLRV